MCSSAQKDECQTDRWPGTQAGKSIKSQKQSDTVSLQGNTVRCFDWLTNNQENQTGVWLVSYDPLMKCPAVRVWDMSTELKRQGPEGEEGEREGRGGRRGGEERDEAVL